MNSKFKIQNSKWIGILTSFLIFLNIAVPTAQAAANCYRPATDATGGCAEDCREATITEQRRPDLGEPAQCSDGLTFTVTACPRPCEAPPPAPPPPPAGCCIPSCTESTTGSCSGGDFYSPDPCASNASCPGGGGSGVGGAGAGTPSTARCCVSSEGCQEPIAGAASGSECTGGRNPDGRTCSEIEVCRTVQQLRTTPSATGSCPAGAVCLPNPLGESRIQVIAGRVISVLTGGAGMIALLMFIYGGFQWLTAAGNPEKIKKGRDILVWSILGMIIMFGAYVGVRYILQALVAGVSQP